MTSPFRPTGCPASISGIGNQVRPAIEQAELNHLAVLLV